MLSFPYYNSNEKLQEDYSIISEAETIELLCQRIYTFEINHIIQYEYIYNFLKSEHFKMGCEYKESDFFYEQLSNIIIRLHKKAIEYGFPNKPMKQIKASEIDLALTRVLYESIEESEFDNSNYWINKKEVQSFMTLRVFPLIVFWRWGLGKKINALRIMHSSRNYFFTLFMVGQLFDRKEDFIDNRWELLKYLNSDIIVQILERTSFGYNKNFSQAIAEEIKNRNSVDATRLVRGCTKRAKFTLSTVVFHNNFEFCKIIVNYLFEWANKNYDIEIKDIESEQVFD